MDDNFLVFDMTIIKTIATFLFSSKKVSCVINYTEYCIMSDSHEWQLFDMISTTAIICRTMSAHNKYAKSKDKLCGD